MNTNPTIDWATWTGDPDDTKARIHQMDVRAFFQPGVRVVRCDEGMDVEATLEFADPQEGWWARPDWPTRRDLSIAQIGRITDLNVETGASLAAAHPQRGLHAEAEQLYRELLEFAETRLPPPAGRVFNGEVVVRALEQHVTMLREIGRPNDAGSVEARVAAPKERT